MLGSAVGRLLAPRVGASVGASVRASVDASASVDANIVVAQEPRHAPCQQWWDRNAPRC
jgi:hypothetical protein